MKKTTILVNGREFIVDSEDGINIQIKTEGQTEVTSREKINPKYETKQSLNIDGIVRENPSLLFSEWNTWEIMTIVKDFARRTADMDEYSKEYKKLEEEYAQMLRLQVINNGLIMTIDDFAKSVQSGGFNCCDGCGCFLTSDGIEGEEIRFDPSWLLSQKSKYKYVAWYNK